MLVGNKTDLSAQRSVTLDEGVRLAQQYEMLFAETSAKLGEGVEDVRNDLTTIILLLTKKKKKFKFIKLDIHKTCRKGI